MIETSRFPHFLDNRLTDGGVPVSLTRRQEDSWYSYLLKVESTSGPLCAWREMNCVTVRPRNRNLLTYLNVNKC
jgi:hypothetical protein